MRQPAPGGLTAPSPRPSERGVFVVFEGGDGAGKSTQARLLADWARGDGFEVVLTREPGGTPIGEQVRALLLGAAGTGMAARAEALLYAADRAHHVASVVRPALERGAVVVQDRYLDSSIAYQGSGRALEPGDVEALSLWATEGLLPDLTVLLDLPAHEVVERLTGPADRLESEPEPFHARVRAAYLALAARAPRRYLVLDATGDRDSLARAVRERVSALLAAKATPSRRPGVRL